MNEQHINERVTASWHARARARGYKPGTQKYQNAEIEFACGAMAAIQAVDLAATDDQLSSLIPVIWPVNIMSGRAVFGRPTAPALT